MFTAMFLGAGMWVMHRGHGDGIGYGVAAAGAACAELALIFAWRT